MKIKNYFFILFLLLIGSVGVKAQMTIGNSEPPHGGALLDLQQPNASTKMGLKLPVVSLADASLYGLTSGDQTKAVGMVVYNDNANIANGHGAGVYVWNGTKWSSLLGTGGSTGEEPTVGTVLCAGLTFMDRNLGANPTADPNPSSYNAGTDASPTGSLNGDYYQWGRKADGHEKWNSSVVAGSVSTTDGNGQVPSSNVTHYGKFITNLTSPNDWRSNQDDNLWNGTSGGLGNPCPTGFRVPTKSEWETVNTTITASNRSNLTPLRQGINVGSTDLFLPAAGSRYGGTGKINFVGFECTYWTSSGGGTGAYYFGTANEYTIINAGYRNLGLLVRCVKN